MARTYDPLKRSFRYYKEKLESALVREQSIKMALKGGAIDPIPHSLFKNLDYEKIYREGITRKVNGQTIRYYGEKAVRVQIESLRIRSTLSTQKRKFIDNYLNAASQTGMSDKQVQRIERAINRLSAEKLTLIIEKDVLPPIFFLYDDDLDPDELFDEIMTAIKSGVSREEVLALRQRAGQYESIVRGIVRMHAKS